ncbi:MAG TPA: YkvA family protein [Anaerolineales bacterium]|nr:YkvA family protein [Anaerolineales bacterium]
MADEKDKLGEELVKAASPKMTEKDLVKVVNKSDEIQKKFYARGPLSRFVDDARLLISAVRDYWSGTYRKWPWGTMAAVVFTLIYVFDPFDLVPDVLPVIGEVDDAAVFAGCLLLIEQDLLAYRKWKGG